MRAKFLQEIIDETPKDVEIFVRWYADLTVRINRILKEKAISQKDLAISLGKNPSEINKWLKGEHNFTLRSLAKLQAELGEELIHISNPIVQFTDAKSFQPFKLKVLRSTAYNKEVKFVHFEVNSQKSKLSNVS